MKDETIVKIVAILTLGAILITNFFTMKIDSTFTATVSAIIGGIAGYQIGVHKAKKES